MKADLICAEYHQPSLPCVREAAVAYQAQQRGVNERLRIAIQDSKAAPIAIADLRAQFPDVTRVRVKRILDEMRNAGKLNLECNEREAVRCKKKFHPRFSFDSRFFAGE